MLASKKLIALFAALALGAAAQVSAEETSTDESGTTSIKAKELKKEKKEGDIDDEITNARMRANLGSKSKLSMSVGVSYTGGSIEKPFDKQRPALSVGSSSLRDVSMGGSVSGRYRMNKNVSFTGGVGFGFRQPFHSSLESYDQAEENFTIDDPYVGVSSGFRSGRLQNSLSASVSYGSSDGSQADGIDGGVGVSYTGLTTLQAIPLTMGLSFSVSRYILADDASFPFETAAGMYPFMEYSLSDTYSLRTVFGYFTYYFTPETDWDKGIHDELYQSIGVGISVTRDVYLYPNFQFLPEDAKLEKTNVAISATINAF